MIRHEVKSSNVSWVAYDPASRRLYVQFHSGLYQYDRVPHNVLGELLAAESVGKFLHARVRAAFPFAKIARVVTEMPILAREIVKVTESGRIHPAP